MGTEVAPVDISNDTKAMKPHVAVIASPGLGHVTPLLQLSLRLVNHHNFQVSFLNITTEASAAQTNLLHSHHLPSDLHVIDLPPVDVSSFATSTTILARLSIIVEQSLLHLHTIFYKLTRIIKHIFKHASKD